MKYTLFKKCLVLGIIVLFVVAGVAPSTISMTTSDKYSSARDEKAINGYVLFTPEVSTETYLINNSGEVVHSWESDYLQGLGVYLLENGNLLRTDLPYLNPTFFGGGITGRVEIFDWNGSLLWYFEYSNNQHCLHHDVEMLPNGNILMIAWEHKTAAEAVAAGRNPNFLPTGEIWPDHIIEVEPTGAYGGDIVWEWHAWDHLIQDYDPTKDNYGVVADHPELIDINFVRFMLWGDLYHINSIDYNEEFDQIILSAHNQHEIWVIDHSTTTAEAAGHTGGNSGKGGDLLYRWGNPQAYRAGTKSDQKLFNQHDAQWIESGCPGEGNILVFNNGVGRPGPDYSSVDEIVPPVDINGNYFLMPGSAYGPKEQIWIYTPENPYDFFAGHLSGAQRLYDGNTLICDGPNGKFFEVTPEMATVWEYVNPYPNPLNNNVFKIHYYESESSPNENPDLDCEGSLEWTDIKSGETVNGNFQVMNIGGSGSLLNWEITSYPSEGTWSFNPESGESLTPEDGSITVQVSVVAPGDENREFDGIIQIENQENSEDFDVIPVCLKTPRTKIFNRPFLLFIQNHPNAFPIIRHLFDLE